MLHRMLRYIGYWVHCITEHFRRKYIIKNIYRNGRNRVFILLKQYHKTPVYVLYITVISYTIFEFTRKKATSNYQRDRRVSSVL